MNVTVYLGANNGHNPIYMNEVKRLGTWLGEHGHRLIYGGSKIGLMGALATSVLKAGGEAIGVEPQFFVDSVLQLEGLTELIVTPDMPVRKAKMIELGEAFIAFPGGTGTAEEISEVISMGCIGLTNKKYAYYNFHHFYDPVKEQYEKMVEEGFMTKENYDKIHFIESLEELDSFLR